MIDDLPENQLIRFDSAFKKLNRSSIGFYNSTIQKNIELLLAFTIFVLEISKKYVQTF